MEKKKYITKIAKFVLAILPVAIIGGFFTGIYGFEELTPDIKEQIIEQIGSKELFYAVTTIQTVLYAVIAGSIGYIIADKLGLIRPFKVEKKPLIKTLVLTVICGVVLSTDNLIFSGMIPQIAEMYLKKPTLAYWIASVAYGGVVEEVLMRLFLMSLLSFVVWKICFRNKEQVPAGVLIFANVVTALVFAAGHLPATLQMFGEITPVILFRCMLLNSFGGLIFGHLYRKHGIQYSFIAHAGAHIVWKIIWVLFI